MQGVLSLSFSRLFTPNPRPTQLQRDHGYFGHPPKITLPDPLYTLSLSLFLTLHAAVHPLSLSKSVSLYLDRGQQSCVVDLIPKQKPFFRFGLLQLEKQLKKKKDKEGCVKSLLPFLPSSSFIFPYFYDLEKKKDHIISFPLPQNKEIC